MKAVEQLNPVQASLGLELAKLKTASDGDGLGATGAAIETSVPLGDRMMEIVDWRVLVTVVVPDKVVSGPSNGVGAMPHSDRYFVTVSVTLLVMVTSKRSSPPE